MFKCKSHPRGHKKKEAADACDKRAERRAGRLEKLREDAERREATARACSAEDFITKEYCREGAQPERVAARLNREYPKRKPPWSWVDVITHHAEKHMYKMDGSFSEWLKANPEVMLPSELKKRAGIEGTDEARL